MAQQARPKLSVHSEDLRGHGEQLVGGGGYHPGYQRFKGAAANRLIEQAGTRAVAGPQFDLDLTRRLAEWNWLDGSYFCHSSTPLRQAYTMAKPRTARNSIIA